MPVMGIIQLRSGFEYRAWEGYVENERNKSSHWRRKCRVVKITDGGVSVFCRQFDERYICLDNASSASKCSRKRDKRELLSLEESVCMTEVFAAADASPNVIAW